MFSLYYMQCFYVLRELCFIISIEFMEVIFKNSVPISHCVICTTKPGQLMLFMEVKKTKLRGP
jgi:hypothetical protein